MSTRPALIHGELTNVLFSGIFPADNVITAVQKNHGVHKMKVSEPAAWVLNGTHWFSALQQPMVIVTGCHNWEDASKFQYLMQILQAHYGEYMCLDSRSSCSMIPKSMVHVFNGKNQLRSGMANQ